MELYPKRNRFSLQIKKLIGFRAGKLNLYELALIPRSSSQSTEDNIVNNERLEYLGDAVLETIITEFLFQKYPNEDEGFLTKARSSFVKRENLNDIGKQLGLQEFVKPPVNHNQHGKNFLGNTLEALIGAMSGSGWYDEVAYTGGDLVNGTDVTDVQLNVIKISAAGAEDLDDISSETEGQLKLFFFADANVTVNHHTSYINLQGGANVNFAQYDTLLLVSIDGVWYEVQL